MGVHVGREMTRTEYDDAIAAGLIEEDEKVELLAGRVVEVMTEGPPHVGVILRLERALNLAVDPDAWIVSGGHPLALSDHDEPEPDVAVVRFRRDFYAVSHPGPEDVGLLVEVSDSSRGRDLSLKAQRYALAGIEDYWVVDLVDRVTVVHRGPDPRDGTWQDVTTVPAGTTVRPLHLGEVELTPLVA